MKIEMNSPASLINLNIILSGVIIILQLVSLIFILVFADSSAKLNDKSFNEYVNILKEWPSDEELKTDVFHNPDNCYDYDPTFYQRLLK